MCFIFFFPSSLYCFVHFFSNIKTILPIHMFSCLYCSSLVSDAVLPVHPHWWAIKILSHSPSGQPYSSHLSVVKGLGMQRKIHFVSCFPLINHMSWALPEPRKEKSAEGIFLDVRNALQPTCQSPVLKKWIKDHIASQKTAVTTAQLLCCIQLLTSSTNTLQPVLHSPKLWQYRYFDNDEQCLQQNQRAVG